MSEPSPAPPRGATTGRREAAHSAVLLSGGLIASRLLGLVRDVLLAFYLGTGHAAEAWMVAYRIPFFLRAFLTEGMLNSAMVPILNEYLETSSRKEVHRFASAAASAVALIFLVISVAAVLATPYIVPWISPGFTEVPGKIQLTVQLMQITFALMFLFGVAGVLMSILQSLGYFLTSSISPVLFNVVFIGSFFTICPMFGDEPERWVFGLAVGAIVAGVVQTVIHIRPLYRRGLLPRPTLSVRHPGVSRMLRLMVPTLFGAGVSEMAIIANTLLASLLGGGAVASIEYASRIGSVPHMIVAGALATAMLPLMSKQSARGETDELKHTLAIALRVSVFLMVPIALVVYLHDEEIVRLLLERGAFAESSTRTTGAALGAMVPMFIGGSTLRILVAAFFSSQDTRTPVIAGVFALSFNLLAGWVLMRFAGVAGLALAMGLTPCVGSAILLVAFTRRRGGLPGRGMMRSVVTVLAGTAILAAAVIGMRGMHTAPESTLVSALYLSASMALGLASFAVVAAIARPIELRSLQSMLRRRVASS